ncbi:septum formation protein Maf [Myxozyma melibiosi]|uniref:Septum formation protein Maf n=1 Tax=Myxozyma melibiosi TaxID=54550 RepID=A0ABR1FCF1_9ASCO
MSEPPSYTDSIATKALNLPVFAHLKGKRVILASGSPRRKELLQQIGLTEFEVVKSDFAEDLDKKSMSVYEYVKETASQKAITVYQREIEAGQEPALVIAADTVILSKNMIVEKPKSSMDHFRMLQSLRDEKFPHRVFTAVACIAPLEQPVYPGYNLQSHTEETQVYFDKDVSDEFLSAYVADGEANDAAGGYCIQGKGALMIDQIVGDYNNVVGLPLKSLVKLIEKTIYPEDDDFEDGM